MIGGTMGVGKTAVCQKLKKQLDNAIFLDGDWCWDADPFQVTEKTKAMVLENICFLLNQFIHSDVYENIIFCWVMHEQSIIDSILNKLDLQDCEVKSISLICDEESLRNRLQHDIDNGIRSIDVVERSIARIPLYEQLDTIKVVTDNKSIEQISEEISNCYIRTDL